MNALEAKAITMSYCNQAAQKTLDIILLKIKEIAMNGQFTMTDSKNINDLDICEEKILVSELEKLGYKVTIKTYAGDYWGDSGGKTLTISWR